MADREETPQEIDPLTLYNLGEITKEQYRKLVDKDADKE